MAQEAQSRMKAISTRIYPRPDGGLSKAEGKDRFVAAAPLQALGSRRNARRPRIEMRELRPPVHYNRGHFAVAAALSPAVGA